MSEETNDNIIDDSSNNDNNKRLRWTTTATTGAPLTPTNNDPNSIDFIEQMRKVSNQRFTSQMNQFSHLCKVFRKQEHAFSYISGIQSHIENDELQKNKSHKKKLFAFVREQIFVFSFQWNPLHDIYLRDMFSNWDQVFSYSSRSSLSSSFSFSSRFSSPVSSSSLSPAVGKHRTGGGGGDETDGLKRSFSPVAVFSPSLEQQRSPSASQQERYFCVASLEAFWKSYHKLPNHVRHFYEIVRYDDHPCFMYFDIEVNKAANSDWNQGEQLISFILSDLQRELHRTKFATAVNRKEKTVQCELLLDNVLDMDSSTQYKFSRHLLIRLKDKETGKLVAFENNVELGHFIKNWISNLRQQINCTRNHVTTNEKTVDSSILFVKKDAEDDNWVSAIDEGVYTRNRAFRLFLSCKYQPHLGLHSAQQLSHKDIALLRLSDSNKYAFPVKMESLPKAYFEHSLISNVGNRDELVIVVSDGEHEILSSPVHPVRSLLFHSPGSVSKFKKEPERMTPDEINLIKMFILSIVPNGFIRRFNYYEETEGLVFYIGGNKYCENIQREHKSNHVFYVVSLARGGGIYYQRCTDPDCKEFCSIERKIPLEYLPSYLQHQTPAEDSNENTTIIKIE